jgi:NADP-dependent 3-hydroxy acid dehydrogenase YdfG
VLILAKQICPDVARPIVFALQQPPHMKIEKIVVFPAQPD